MSPTANLANDTCEIETARVIRPSAGLAWRSRLGVIRQTQKPVEGVTQNTSPEGK